MESNFRYADLLSPANNSDDGTPTKIDDPENSNDKAHCNGKINQGKPLAACKLFNVDTKNSGNKCHDRKQNKYEL